MALNLVRNSKVYFTTNVSSSTGVVQTSGFTTSNTQELQVLDGFTFSQTTNQDTVTISEAGSDPVRGQRAFNTSLAPVDFSFSTYVRPAIVSTAATAEESVLWNALLSTTAIDSGTAVATSGSPTATYAWDAATGTGTLTLAGISFSTTLGTGAAVTLAGVTHATAATEKALNSSSIIKSTTPATTSATTAVAYTCTGMVLELTAPITSAVTSITIASNVTKIYSSPGWVSSVLPTSSTKYALSTVAGSNKNQLQKFGMIFTVDNVTYAIDNCALNQVTLDFGLDAIATLAWTGQATALREITLTGSISVANTVVTNLPTTENLFIGNVVQYSGTGGLTPQSGSSVTIATITGPTSLTLTGGTLTTSGTASSFKVFNYSATATIGAVVGSASPWTAPLTGLTSTQGISVGDSITASSGAGTWGTGTAVVASVDSATAITVRWTGGVVPVAGGVTAVYVTIATLGTAATSITANPKNTSAPFITNKLSTVSFTTLNALGVAVPTTYSVALTGGSITINNNINYITPANLGTVNVPTTYYTGTRAISGTLNAYLKTGSGVGSTGQLLSDMLAASTSSVEPMAALTISIGGSSTSNNRVELEMPSVTFTIPTIDVQQVVSTAINFTAEGSVLGATAGNTFAVDELNDLAVRYYPV